MRIEWLDEKCTRARLIRRDWPRFWRRLVAEVEIRTVRRDDFGVWANPFNENGAWFFVETKDQVPGQNNHLHGWTGLQRKLHQAGYDVMERRKLAEKRRIEKEWSDKHWRPIASLPEARLLKNDEMKP